MVYQWLTNWIPRLGKVRLGKDSIDNVYCTELESSSSMPEEKAAIALTLNDKSEYPIFDKDIAAWKELYPNVDILQELRKMKGWLNSNHTRRKTKKGILKFVNAWLAKEQDKGGYRNESVIKIMKKEILITKEMLLVWNVRNVEEKNITKMGL